MSDSERATILIADDHPLFREAMQRVAAEVFADHTFIEVDTCEKALTAIDDENLELIFLDLNMPGMDGFNGLVSLRNAAPSVPIIVVSASEDPATVHEAITYGAAGFMPKSLEKDAMVAAVRHVLEGGIFAPNATSVGRGQKSPSDAKLLEGISQLTHQQRIVLQMLVSGQPNKQIAYELNIVESTVKAHVSAILRKLKVHSRTQAVIKAGKILALLGDLKDAKPSAEPVSAKKSTASPPSAGIPGR
jgi:DNA-binding NarL/FixJ family response regulator